MTAKKNQAKPDMLDENLTFLEHLFSKSQSLYDKIVLVLLTLDFRLQG